MWCSVKGFRANFFPFVKKLFVRKHNLIEMKLDDEDLLLRAKLFTPSRAVADRLFQEISLIFTEPCVLLPS